MMKIHRRIAAGAVAVLGAFGASNVLAQEATPDTWISEAKSSLSRAEVLAELAAAQAAARGQFHREEMTFASAPVLRTRAEVVAELAQARASGEYELINAEAMLFAPALRRTYYALLAQ